ncbi:MAG TPA: hypothetical protein VFR35_20175 [Actinoplanes sp.]|nr:hypothetical protein [Actinoplanes sp.]
MKKIMDEHEVRRLLRPLAGEPAGPSTVDVPRAMAEGRRRRRARSWATGTAVAALTATSVAGGTLAVTAVDRRPPPPVPWPVPSTAAPFPTTVPAVPTGCTVTRLPTGGAEKAVVTGGDPTGRYLAGRIYPDPGRSLTYRLVIWRDGKIFGQPKAPGSDPVIDDLNADGLGVGSSYPGDSPMPYAYRDSRATRLKGGTGRARAVSDSGVIVGQIGTAAARWDSISAAPEPLKVPAGTADSVAIDIDRSGTIVGTVQNLISTDETTGYLWRPDGTGGYLPLPMIGKVRAAFFWPESMNNGWIVGRGGISDAGTTRFAAFRYRIDTGRYERLPDEAVNPARVASNGWVLAAGRRPVVVTLAEVVELPGYQKEPAYQLTSLSDDGLIAGGHSTGLDEGATNQPLMWRCRLNR